MDIDKNKNKKEFIEKIIEAINKIEYVQPEDIPNIDLYMDQVTTFMDQHLESFKRYEEDKLLTKTMINNYTKNNLLPSPEKKKYTKDHMFFLIFIYYMKNVMSITDIQSLLNPLSEKFFNKKGGINLEDIYKEVFDTEEEQTERIIKDILHKYDKSMMTFKELDESEEKELLRIFTFICTLCIDIYMKKQVIERIIDDYFMPYRKKEAQEKKSNDKEHT